MPQYISTDPTAGYAYQPIDQTNPGAGNRGQGLPLNGTYAYQPLTQPAPAGGPIGGMTDPSNGQMVAYRPPDPSVAAAQQQQMAQGGGQPNISGPTTDPAQITAWLQWQANQPGADPILKTPDGIAYYLSKIQQTGGLSPSNTSYWQNKSTLASAGGAVGAGGGNPGTGGGFGNFQGGTPYQLPTEAEAMAMPGYQFAYDQGQKAVQSGAAARGTLLGGPAEKALVNYGVGSALQGYSTLANLGLAANNQNFNQALATNQTNFGQNSTIAGLGYNATNSSWTA